MDNTIKAALITGTLGIIGSFITAYIGTQYGKNYAIIHVNAQVESGIDENESLSINNVDDLISEYNKTNEKNLDLQNSYDELKEKYQSLEEDIKNNYISIEEHTDLKQSCDELQQKNKSLEENILNNYISIEEYSELQQSYDDLVVNNKSLQQLYDELDNEYKALQQSNEELNEKYVKLLNEKHIPDSITGTISIFDLDTFKGINIWYTSSEELIDTYNNKYPQGHHASHSSKSESDINGKFVPTYLLDSKYSKCEGKIAWPKKDKNVTGDCWIDFYCDGILKYSTNKLNADNGVLSFEFSVENVEKLKIVCNGKTSNYSVYIIYEYLNLVP